MVRLGKGDGTFQSAVGYCSGGLGADSIAVGDVNGDGKPDLLVANSGTASSFAAHVGVLLNSGTIMAGSLPASDPYLSVRCPYLAASGMTQTMPFKPVLFLISQRILSASVGCSLCGNRLSCTHRDSRKEKPSNTYSCFPSFGTGFTLPWRTC